MRTSFLIPLAVSIFLAGCAAPAASTPAAPAPAVPATSAAPSGTTVLCATDTLACPNGTTVTRDPQHQCAFPSCPIPTPSSSTPVSSTTLPTIPLATLMALTPTFDSSTDQTRPITAGDTVAHITTTTGDIWLRLFPTQAPTTVQNFIGLAGKHYYDGIIFHRVIPNFMIQTGDPTGTGTGGQSFSGKDFADEPNPDLHNIRGAVSMANRGPNTNGSQFFIVQNKAGAPYLDGYQNGRKTCGTPGMSCHTVFGQVFAGLDVVDTIAAAKRDSRDKPLVDIAMKNVEIYTVQ